MSLCQITDIEARLQRELQPDWLVVIDESSAHAGHLEMPPPDPYHPMGVTHVRVRIFKREWQGLRRVEQHRLVYDALRDCLDQGLHALAIDLLTAPPAA